MLSFVVHQWYEYQGARNKDDVEPSDKLRSIPFDKLVTFVTRLWDKLYAQRDMLKLDSLGSEINLSLDTEGLTFPCPMREMSGKHGPGEQSMMASESRNTSRLFCIGCKKMILFITLRLLRR